MAFNLEIRLDRPDGVYLAGEEISGVVTIHDPDGGRGRLQLVREWRAHGRGGSDFGSRAEQTLATTWERGATEVPFTLPMPSGPFTYRGQHTNLDWYARAERGGILGKTKAETDFVYGAVPQMPDVDFGPAYTAPVTLKLAGSSATNSPVRIALIGVAIVIYPLLLWSVISEFPALIAIPLAAMMLITLGSAGFRLIRNRVAQVKLGDVKLEVAPLMLSPNDAVQVRFSTVVKADLGISQITVKLLQNEFYASGSGKNRTTSTKAVFENAVEVSAQHMAKTGEVIAFDLELTIPEGAATTFMAPDNAVTWQVSVTVAIAWWPDWQRVQAITVRP